MLTIADSRMVLVISKHSDFDAAHMLCEKTNKGSKKCNDHLSIDRRIASGFLQSAAMNFLTFLGMHVRHDTVLESVVFFSSVYQSDPIESSQILHCMLICRTFRLSKTRETDTLQASTANWKHCLSRRKIPIHNESVPMRTFLGAPKSQPF